MTNDTPESKHLVPTTTNDKPEGRDPVTGTANDKPALLTTIPIELRNQIYSNILLEKDAVFIRPDGTLGFKYDIGLFSVNKQISYESLYYFHSQNVFVAVETNFWFPLLGSLCNYGIPIVFTNPHSTGIVDSCALRIKVDHYETQARFASVAVMTIRHLPNFVQYLNAFYVLHPRTLGQLVSATSNVELYPIRKLFVWASTENGVSKFHEIPFIFSPRDKPSSFTVVFQCLRSCEALADSKNLQYYQENIKVASSIEDALNGFRRAPVQRVGGEDVKMQISFGGDFTTTQEANITSSVLPTMTREESITVAKATKDKGDALFQVGDYLAARAKYGIAAYLLGENLWLRKQGPRYHREDRIDWSRITTEHQQLLLHTFLGGFRTALRLGKDKSAKELLRFVIYRRLYLSLDEQAEVMLYQSTI